MDVPPDAAEPQVDGRRARGQRRRAEIIAATLRVVERDGVAGATHRTVAREAGAPTSLITYHFATLDDLLVAALSTVVDDYVEQLNDVVEQHGDELGGLAELIAASGGPGRTRALAERELTTLAARRPALRGTAARWRDTVAEIGERQSSRPLAGRALMAAADGMCTAVLLGDEPPDVEAIRAVLAQAVNSAAPDDPIDERPSTT